MYPENPIFDNRPEEQVYKYMKKNLPEEYIGYYNYNIADNEFDICLFVPYRGILMIEIKGWRANQVLEVIDNNFIRYRTMEGEKVLRSPYGQARGYSFKLKDELRKRIPGDVLVLPITCYTNITEEEYKDKRLDIISPKQLTIFKEDFEYEDRLLVKINQMFDNTKLSYNINTDYFDLSTRDKAREIFEPSEKIKKSRKKTGFKKNNISRPSKEFYSLLRYIPEEEMNNIETISNELLNHWKSGTKLIIITNSNKVGEVLSGKMEGLVNDLNIGHRFAKGIYNFYLYIADIDLDKGFQIIDGDMMEVFKHRRVLRVIDAQCDYNLNQYMIEHYVGKKHIIVKAGAGTGKTFTMISRIMFLIHKEKIYHSDLADQIFLMTFTNEAADSMKEKLKEELMNYYIITADFNYFEMINAVEDMKVSTIHSLAKDILRKYSSYLGLGKDFSITSGKYERTNNLIYALNNYIDHMDKEELKKYDLSMYNIRKVIEKLMTSLENKNIDMLRTELILEDGNNKEFNKLIKTVLLDAERGTRDELQEGNSLKLADLIMSLREITNQLYRNPDVNSIDIKYLFIDEFQDTDNIQIDFIKDFLNIFNFKLFVVGDVKQCIYRFRGAEENAFQRLKEPKYRCRWRNFSLNKNYRTDKYLLESFEDIFRKWGSINRLQYRSSKDSLKSNIELNQKDESYFKKIKIKSDDDIEFENKLIEELKYRKKQIEEEFEDKSNSDFSKRTIAILVRENKEANKIMEISRKHRLGIEIDKGGNLYKLQSTLDFYRLIISLQNNRSPKHLYNLYDTNYVTKELPLKEIYLRKQDEESLLKYFYSNPPIKNWNYYLSELKKEPTLKVLREIVLDIKPWRIYKKKSGLGKKDSEEYKKNLDLLFEELTKNTKNDYLTINKIEQNLGIMIKTGQEERTRIYSDNRENEVNIKCMTVHKSKGLEFHTVILPYTNMELATDKKLGRYDFIIIDGETRNKVKVGYSIKKDQSYRYIKNKYYRDEENIEGEYSLKEETRILYVAMTRAIKNLSYFEYENLEDIECWQKFLENEGELL